MNILVTGIAGFIGHKVAKRLLKDGHNIIGIDNLSANSYTFPLWQYRLNTLKKYSPQFTFHIIDVSDTASIQKLFFFTPIDAIIHLAAKVGVRDSISYADDYIKTNVVGTVNILECAKMWNIKKVIFASTSSVYEGCRMPYNEFSTGGVLLSPYAISKRAAEGICDVWIKRYGLDITILRLFTVYGPAGRPDMFIWRAIDAALNGTELIVFGDGTQKRDFTYIDDIVTGIIKALHTEGSNIINLGNNNPHEVNEIIKIIEDLAKTKIKIVYKLPDPSDMQITYADITQAKEILGWMPEINIEEGIMRTFDWFSNEWYTLREVA